MTEDKKFKRLVREAAKQAGTNYTTARHRLRPAEGGSPPAAQEPATRPDVDRFAADFAAISAAAGSGFFAGDGMLHLLTIGLVGGARMLFTDPPGTGQTAAGASVAAAVAAGLMVVDGAPDLAPDDMPSPSWDEVMLLNAFDHLTLRSQRAALRAGRGAAMLLAKRHPDATRVPFPLTDEVLDVFELGVSLGLAGPDVELRIVAGMASGAPSPSASAAVDLARLAEMGATAAAVEVPADVQQGLVDIMQGVRSDPALVSGAAVTASLAVTRLARVAAAADARAAVRINDIVDLLPHVLRHRAVLRTEELVDDVVARAAHAVRR